MCETATVEVVGTMRSTARASDAAREARVLFSTGTPVIAGVHGEVKRLEDMLDHFTRAQEQ